MPLDKNLQSSECSTHSHFFYIVAYDNIHSLTHDALKLVSIANVHVVCSSRPGQNTTYPVLDPCLPQSMPLESEDEKSVKHYFKGTGSYNECRSALTPLLNLTVPCPQEPCSMNGVSQPLIDHTRSSFYGFSEFWYTMEDVYHKGGNYSSAIFNKYSSVSEQDFLRLKNMILQDLLTSGGHYL